ncbi:MAG: hypothetical protein PHS32_21575 [Rhodoferax sp.]|uniref:hypothetical protein n=1 Tax=Rhodoferax sp. TaxID=50421 RepID=UPI00261C53CE|nr:hypothetical protein [Rhodoferax sp.]MDD5336337.1 hypothetical protein [Rhodoferax sp.]
MPCFHSIERTGAPQRSLKLVAGFQHSSDKHKKTALGQPAGAVTVLAKQDFANGSREFYMLSIMT